MITVQDLTFTYAGVDRPAIRKLTFAVQQGEILGFLGPSGAGKSTTQKILRRSWPPPPRTRCKALR